MPRGSRFDRRYCSSTCRVRAHDEYHSPEQVARRQALKDDPVHQAQVAALRAFGEAYDGRTDKQKAVAELRARARATAEVCGDCGTDMPTSQVVWRTVPYHDRVYTTCYACRCDGESHNKPHQTGGRCEKCRPYGTWANVRWSCSDAHSPDPAPYCRMCHPKAWREPRPCQGCGRIVMNHISVRPGYRRSRISEAYRWEYEPGRYDREAGKIIDTSRVFCSDRCRRSTFAQERAQARAEREPIDCRACGERLDARRRDARFCSPACRQRAYRLRVAA
jgi:hypothetical protein